MSKLIVCAAFWSLATINAFADISHGNRRIDHALYPQHPPKLVVAGEIKEIKSVQYTRESELSFEVERVILGNPALTHTRISVSTSGFEWPEELVPRNIGVFCILILDSRFLYAVAPSSKDGTRIATNQVGAIHILEEEILSALKSETSPNRQVAILLQLAPILRRENISAVIPFEDAKDPWVKRAALAALIYATEQPDYILLAASDIKSFFAEESPIRCLKQTRLTPDCEPARRFMKNYFFLQKDSWRWGSRWSEEEADKNIRIWNAILSTSEVPAKLVAFVEAPE
jgi:hypothetical protein